MRNFSGKYKIVVTFLVLTSILTAILSVDRKAPTFVESSLGLLIAPVQTFNTGVFSWLKDKKKYFSSVKSLSAENDALKKELLDTRAELNRLNLIENENSQLEALLDIKNQYKDYSVVGAKVIGKDPGNWFSTFTIDKGTDSGLNRNMVVMTQDGLVGKITECGYNYSKVISIINDSDAVSSQTLRGDNIGYITGDLNENGMCKMQYSEDISDILIGDTIVTSHLSNIFPEGITIGNVQKLTVDKKTGMHYAIISPSVDFRHLDYVLVINKNFEKTLVETTTTNQ